MLAVFVQNPGDLEIEVVLGKRGIIFPFSLYIARNLTLVFLQQADRVVLRVTLEKHDTKQVRTHRQVNPRFLALDQNL